MHKTGCVVCGADLIYLRDAVERTCAICKKQLVGNVACKAGHFVCDACHSLLAIEEILHICLESKSKNPIEILRCIMANPAIHMHGPEHHMMVGASLLTAYKNSGGEITLETALSEMVKRGKTIPGGACGFWGCCGAAVSTGIFLSIVTGSNPLLETSYAVIHEMTAKSLNKIAEIGGPRCCKRNSFLTVISAVEFVEKSQGIQMELPETIICTYSAENQECIHNRCPFFQ